MFRWNSPFIASLYTLSGKIHSYIATPFSHLSGKAESLVKQVSIGNFGVALSCSSIRAPGIDLVLHAHDNCMSRVWMAMDSFLGFQPCSKLALIETGLVML